MNPTSNTSVPGTLYNPKTGVMAVPTANTTISQQTSAMGQGFSPLPSTINSSNITNATPYNLPPTPVTPTTGNLANITGSTMASATAVPSPITTTPSSSASDNPIQTKLDELKTTLVGNSQQIADINANAGLAMKKQKATELSAQLDQIDKDYRDQVQQIKQSSGGTLAGQQDVLRVAQEKYQNTRANAALSYNVAVNDYNGSQAIVNEKINTLKDSNQQALDLYKLNVDAIRNDLTDKEAKQLDANLQMKRDESKTVNDTYATVLQNSSQNGAPFSVYSAIDRVQEDYRLGKISASEAQTRMYQAAGNYAQDKTKVLDAQYKQKEIDKKDTRSYTETDASGKTTLVTIDGQTGALISKTDLGNIGKPTGKGGANGGGKAVYTDPRSLPESLKNSLLDDIVLNHGTPDQLYAAYPEINKTTIKDLYEHFSLQGTNLNPAPTNKKTSTTTGIPGLK